MGLVGSWRGPPPSGTRLHWPNQSGCLLFSCAAASTAIAHNRPATAIDTIPFRAHGVLPKETRFWLVLFFSIKSHRLTPNMASLRATQRLLLNAASHGRCRAAEQRYETHVSSTVRNSSAARRRGTG